MRPQKKNTSNKWEKGTEMDTRPDRVTPRKLRGGRRKWCDNPLA